ncbi:MAG: MaoC/PaaZ C-terminal domain-containing protein [Rubrivivax sp.]
MPQGCPLLASQSVGTLLVARLFAELGVNLRHVLHLSHDVRHPLGTAPAMAATRLLLSCRLHRSVRVGADRVLLVLQTRMSDDDTDRCVAVTDDAFLVRRVPVSDVAAADADRSAWRGVLARRHRGCAIDPDAPGVLRAHMPIAPDAAQRYGRVAGDLNPVHAGGLLAWLLGAGRPVVQGLYLRNRVVRELAAWGCPLGHLSITFVNPVETGQTLFCGSATASRSARAAARWWRWVRAEVAAITATSLTLRATQQRPAPSNEIRVPTGPVDGQYHRRMNS